MMLYNQYRPAHWDDIVGHDEIIGMIKKRISHGILLGKAYWITGASGIGKSSIARLLAKQAVSHPDYAPEEPCAGLERSKLEIYSRVIPDSRTNDGGRALILNDPNFLEDEYLDEVNILVASVAPQNILIFVSRTSDEKVFLDKSELTRSIFKQCILFDLKSDNLVEPFARRAYEIAQKENLTNKPYEAFVQLVESHHCSLFAVLSAIQSGKMLSD